MHLTFLRTVFSCVLAGASLAAAAQAPGSLKIGVTSYTAAAVETAAQEAKGQGLDVRVIEFADWTTPNAALDAGDLDVNYFQHQAFLDNAIKQRGYKLKSVGLGVLSSVGLFSNKASRVEDIKEGARLGIHNDTSNQARALKLLDSIGLIQLKPGVGEWASIDDVVKNPKKLKFIEIEGTQMIRSFQDIDIAVLSPFALVLAGQSDLANRALVYSKGDDVYYAGRFVTRADRTEDPRVRKFIGIYQNSPAVRKAIGASFADNDKLYSLPWLRN